MIDTSMYQTIRPAPQLDQQPSLLDTMGKAYGVATAANQLRTQQGMRDAYANNVGPDGQLNQSGFLSELGKVNPQAAIQMQNSLAESGKLAAEAQTAKMTAAKSISDVVQPKLEYLATVDPDARPAAHNAVMKELEQQGVPMHSVPKDSQGNYIYDENLFNRQLNEGRQAKSYFDTQLVKAEIGAKQAEAAMVPVKRNAELYGSRSPNAEISSQYAKDAGPLKGSQMPMAQMLDNYKNPSPQGDASLVLNAFKIKFPNAPDVNSLEELSKSQAATDQWKQIATHALSGGLDQATRDNLMRDGISTFRANRDSLRGVQERYNARAKQQNISDPTLTYEPAMDKTFAEAMDLQNKIGPYVPPSQREGLAAKANNFVSNLVGVGGKKKAADDNNAYAAKPSAAMTPHDAEALHWLGLNPNDQNAAAVRAKLQGKGLLK